MRKQTGFLVIAAFLSMSGFGLAESVYLVQQTDEENSERKHHRVVIKRDFTFGGGAFMGVQVLGLTSELREHFGVDPDRGVMVSKVEPDSPAEAGGIQVGDILISVDGDDVQDGARLARMIRGREKGDTANIELVRRGRLESVELTIDKRERGGVYRVGPGAFGFFGSADEDVEGPHREIEFEWTEDSRLAFEEAMETLEQNLESGEWKEKLELIESMDFSHVQERMREVERRLKELEKELKQKQKQDQDQ